MGLFLFLLIGCGSVDDAAQIEIEDTADEVVLCEATGDEICDMLDNDCDGSVDEDATDALTWYRDVDSDGYGIEEESARACFPPSGYAYKIGDCNDANGAIYPGAVETCDMVDNDCDGLDDKSDPDLADNWYYFDRDGDGYGGDGGCSSDGSIPDGAIHVGGDCDDGDPTVYPGNGC